ncbi:uncharacterized protein D12 [Drosophila pseudoobscura]|uniref:Uncharacterized protein D12 n=1 Tax=Drosophila pseudoobscura pseudoobscura TaxID=46245 RepID=A0A6I8ULG9_DROPS|nr:uncharacterized protein LOC4818066 [Drosophila pseudoobscura]
MEQSAPGTPKKRKHSEYHDPDYLQTASTNEDSEDAATNQQKRTKLETESAAEEEEEELDKSAQPQRVPVPDTTEKLERICEIVRVEFQREISLKDEQLAEIDRRLLQARQLLDKLRFEVVSEYYRKQQVPLTAGDVAKVRGGESLFSDESAGPQLPLHPAIKKIVGKRPLLIQNHLPERTAATLAKQTIRQRNPAHRRAERRRQQKIREQGIVIDHSKDQQQQSINIKVEDEQPCTSRQAHERQQQQQLELNASRLNNKNKFNFVVGNTSKYIGGEGKTTLENGGQALVYKWLVYVQGKDLPKPLETYIKKVRFQLHHSYRPNDIVDVHAPPFQLNRRGWGEFPMRIQLFFHEHLRQKPVQLMHTVVLDKTMCGLHTMGAETTVEIWLRSERAKVKQEPIEPPPPPMPVAAPSPSAAALPAPSALPPAPFPPPIECLKPRTISITQNKEELDDNLFAGINKIEMSDDIEQIEPTVLVTEPLKLSYSPKMQPPTGTIPLRSPLRVNVTRPSASRPSVAHLPVNGNSPSPIKSEKSGQVRQAQNGHRAKQNVVFQKAGKLYIIDPQQSKLKQATQQRSLLKPQVSLLKAPAVNRRHQLVCIQHDHGYADMTSVYMKEELQELLNMLPKRCWTSSLVNTAPIRPRKLDQIFGSVQFKSMRSAVEFLLRRLPLTGSPRGDEEPAFVCPPNLLAFQEQSALRQRFYEYVRARHLRRCMMQHPGLQQLYDSGKEVYWSLREIVGFARLHAYTPPLKMLTPTEKRQTKQGSEEQLSQRVQDQLKEDPQPHLSAYCSVSSTNRIDAWIAKQTGRLQGHEHEIQYQEFIDVLGVDASNLRPLSQRKAQCASVANNRQLLYLPPPEHLETATQLVQDMCKDINIGLEAEESTPGVSQSLSLTLLGRVLSMFVERLVRRSVAVKLHQDTIEQLPPPAANLPLCLQPYDIGRAISQCPDMDFLGNSHLGVTPIEPQP